MEYSIVIPTYNRATILRNCLQHIYTMNSPNGDWEVLVVDNGSKDKTREIIKEFQKKQYNLRYFYTERPGLHVGRNLGMEESRGEILCYMDDDSFVSKSWLVGIEEAFKDKDVALVGGPCLPLYESKPPKWIEKLWSHNEYGKSLSYLSLTDFGTSIKEIPANYIYGCNLSIRKNILLKLEGFHPDGMPKELQIYRGDGEVYITLSIIDKGKKALYHPKVCIEHFIQNSRLSKEYFLSRAYNQGISNSYLEYRYNNGKAKYFLNHRSNRRFRKFVRHMINLISLNLFSNYIKEFKKIQLLTFVKTRKGFSSHKKKLKNDIFLQDWCLRENYIGRNGDIPEY